MQTAVWSCLHDWVFKPSLSLSRFPIRECRMFTVAHHQPGWKCVV